MTATFSSVLAGATSPDVFVWRGDPGRDLLGEAHAAGWVGLRLDTTQARGRDDLYDALQRDWSLPDWFGRNLDAWWDVLADRLDDATVLVWDGAVELSEHDPDLVVTVLGLLRDSTAQARAFCVVLMPGPADCPGLVVSELDGLL